jgi:hypothetical protein
MGLVSFLRKTTSVSEAVESIRSRLPTREENFLTFIKHGVYGFPSSPYRPLLEMAGCQLCDVERLLQTTGLEGTLNELWKAGVYVSFEEFKGRKPIVRNGVSLQVRQEDFDNPYLIHRYKAASSGSTGTRSRAWLDLDHLAATVCYNLVARKAHGLLGVPTGLWRPILPACTGIANVLSDTRAGHLPLKWFSPLLDADLPPSLKYRAATQYICMVGQLTGARLPRPEPVRVDEASHIARWARETADQFGACLIRTYVSMAVRISLASQEEGIDLERVTFMGAGEPPTNVKTRQITNSGARYIPSYACSEIGHMGLGCANPIDGCDLHLLHDGVALIQKPQKVPGWEHEVQAFYVTSLHTTSPKLLLNVGLDDYGIFEKRSCGCELDKLGFVHHVRAIQSFSKLTGEGMTLVGSNMQKILEESLPARFGGCSLDYQLLETEDRQGFTKLILRIDPGIVIANEKAVLDAVTEELREAGPAGVLAQALWQQTQTVKIERQRPIWSDSGKFFPFLKLNCQSTETRAEEAGR